MQFLYFGSLLFFSRSGSQKLKKHVGVFLNSIAFKSYRTFLKLRETMRSERTEIAFKEIIFRIIEFPDRFLLIIYSSSIWPNLTKIGQIVVEL